MSRMPKYRVWDRREKKMIPVPNLSFGDDGSSLTVTIWLAKEQVMLVVGENCDLMQFTGICDRTGKEICEGDIVRINHPYDYTGDFTDAIGEVFYWDEKQGAYYHTNNNDRPPKRMWEYVEVIGNIYETPDLLTAHEAKA